MQTYNLNRRKLVAIEGTKLKYMKNEQPKRLNKEPENITLTGNRTLTN